MAKKEKVSLENTFVATATLMNFHQQQIEANKAKPVEFAGAIAYAKSRTKKKDKTRR